ncbi:MAG: HEAT repeat domain-containing protein [Armatimonadota bacterium]
MTVLAATASPTALEPVEPPLSTHAPFVLAGEAIPESRIVPIPVLESHTWALPRLLEGLSSDDALVRARCCFLLGQIADHSALDALAAMLEDPDRDVREFAGMALMRMGDWRGLHAATAAMSGNRWWIRFWAVDAVGRNLWSSAFAPLLSDPDDLVRALAREAQKRQWQPAAAAVRYSGPQDATLEEITYAFVNYLIGETDWWWHAGDYPQILRTLETAVWLDPSYVEGFANAGYLYWSLGRNTEAVATYLRGVQLNPDSWEAHWELGFYHYNAQKRFEKAIPEFARARALGAPAVPARMHAHAREHAGRPREAPHPFGAQGRGSVRRHSDGRLPRC